jgi:energy-coupling factor transporter transmembrane protein EcfT
MEAEGESSSDWAVVIFYITYHNMYYIYILFILCFLYQLLFSLSVNNMENMEEYIKIFHILNYHIQGLLTYDNISPQYLAISTLSVLVSMSTDDSVMKVQHLTSMKGEFWSTCIFQTCSLLIHRANIII